MKNKNTKLVLGMLAVLLVVVVPLTISSLMQQTNTQNNAAGPEPTISLPQQATNNLNNTSDIVQTNNPDGTMGPATANGNWSNALPFFLKGTLLFAVTDPKPTDPGSQ